MKKRKIPYGEYIKIIRMLEVLGFYEIAVLYEKSHHKDKKEKTKKLKSFIGKDDLKIFTSKECTVLNYVKIFVENIKSDGIRDTFEEKVWFYMDDDTQMCTDIKNFKF